MSLPLSYLNISFSSDEEDTSSPIEAIRIGCDGEVNELDVPKFQPFQVSSYDSLFRHESYLSPLSRFIGIPLAARKHPLDGFREVNLHNPEAGHLFRNCDITSISPDATPFGLMSREWTVDVGSVIVARLDKAPLHPLHAAAIAAFCSRHLRGHFQICIEAEQTWRESLPEMRDRIFDQRARCLSEATPAKFAQFFEDYKRQRIRGRPDLLNDENSSTLDRRLRSWSIPLDEIEPRPEWIDVPSPLDV